MAIFVDERTKVVVQGLSPGKEGAFHSLRNKAYGTQIVAGTNPGKGGSDVEGIPIFDTVKEAVKETGANTSIIYVSERFAPDAILEAAGAELPLTVCITEKIPAADMARVYTHLARTNTTRLIGPNCPGLISPGKANVGIIPGEITAPGPVGLVSRSGTLTYQIMHELSQMGIGQSTTVGIGGDPIVGTSFIDCLERFEQDPETKCVVLIGEIGGNEEERAAKFIGDNMTTPVVAYIAGFTAPPGKQMGHAGAIVSGSKGTAAAKAEAFEAVGVRVGRNASEVAELVKAALA
ncbi:MAG TPA: succinate--CoA ligase subunit alpha [Actinomycetota bacterium]|nr:succinate--CoA ligase subunit alpha [Actinomycetota bacterium]